METDANMWKMTHNAGNRHTHQSILLSTCSSTIQLSHDGPLLRTIQKWAQIIALQCLQNYVLLYPTCHPGCVISIHVLKISAKDLMTSIMADTSCHNYLNRRQPPSGLSFGSITWPNVQSCMILGKHVVATAEGLPCANH